MSNPEYSFMRRVRFSESAYCPRFFSESASTANACNERSAQWAWALQLLDDLITNGFEQLDGNHKDPSAYPPPPPTGVGPDEGLSRLT